MQNSLLLNLAKRFAIFLGGASLVVAYITLTLESNRLVRNGTMNPEFSHLPIAMQIAEITPPLSLRGPTSTHK